MVMMDGQDPQKSATGPPPPTHFDTSHYSHYMLNGFTQLPLVSAGVMPSMNGLNGGNTGRMDDHMNADSPGSSSGGGSAIGGCSGACGTGNCGGPCGSNGQMNGRPSTGGGSSGGSGGKLFVQNRKFFGNGGHPASWLHHLYPI
jgi:hypothetical protein